MSNKARSISRQVAKTEKPTPQEVDIRVIRAKNLELNKELAGYLAKFNGRRAHIADDTRELSVAEFTEFIFELGNTVSKLELIRTYMVDVAEWMVQRLEKSDEIVNEVSRSFDQGYEDCEETIMDEYEHEGDDENAFEEESED